MEKNLRQPAGIPSPRSMLSRDKRLPLDTRNLPELKANVFANPRSTLESSQAPYRGIHQSATPSATGESTQKLRESHDTIQRLISQKQELQERVNCMNDSGEFQ